jgi:hypothetical protein
MVMERCQYLLTLITDLNAIGCRLDDRGSIFSSSRIFVTSGQAVVLGGKGGPELKAD